MYVGIDLGTSQSVMAVKGNVRSVEGYPEGLYLDDLGVTLLRTPQGDTAFPVRSSDSRSLPQPQDLSSVPPVRDGEEAFPPPQVASERNSGLPSEVTWNAPTMAQWVFPAVSFLRECAALALGETVERVVLTHPSHLAPADLAELRRAIQEMDLSAVDTRQIMTDGEAAALAYCVSRGSQATQVMICDFGATTFEVTVAHCDNGNATIQSTHVDQHLGGRDLDDQILAWLVNRLARMGKFPELDSNSPQAKEVREQLQKLAEETKRRLGQQTGGDGPLRISEVLSPDDFGRQIRILDWIDRAQYSELVEQHLAKAVECCHIALRRAAISAAQLDQLILIGGSSYGPGVADALASAFGAEATLFHPEHCMAAGAALRAAELGKGFGVAVELDAPLRTANGTIDVQGRAIRTGTGLPVDPPATQLSVSIVASSSQNSRSERTDAEGRFAFRGLPLKTAGEHPLSLVVCDPSGEKLLTASWDVNMCPERGVPLISNRRLPSDVSVGILDARRVVLEAGRLLPATADLAIPLVEVREASILPVYLGNEQVSQVRLPSVPHGSGDVATLILNFYVTGDSQIDVEAHWLTREA